MKSGWLKFSDWLIEWTPFTLVLGYYVVTTAIFVMCSETAIKVFYYFFMIVNFYVALCCAIESFLGMTPIREARKAAMKVDEKGGQFPTPDDQLPIIDMLIVAYLPNEKDIVKDQVMYALEELVYPRDRLRVNLLYNTPKPIEPLETELQEMGEMYDQLRVIKVPASTSKADNLNYFFTLDTGADVIGIFDCDHFPHPYNPRWAAERFVKDKTVDIVQGRCVVYNTNESFQAKMVAIEFDKIYAISHPGRSRMFGFGLFCGSNGYWRAPLLREHKMHGDMLTEDIDSALRAYGKGKNAVHEMNVISYEMAPNNFSAFWKQRMRWAQGWTQASYVHMPMLWNNPPNGKRTVNERFGIFSLLFIREISYYLVTMHTTLMLSFVINNWPHDVGSFVHLIFFRYPMAEWFLFCTIAALFATLWFTDRVRSEFTSWRSMVVFSIVYTPYLILLATMGLYGHARQIVKYSSWNPTARK
ncbi:glycosyltransferase family 2 protein [Polychaeton citri CBS 116435]|uniref:Glycosyltransferase family 2 protein n=1 Tax=Polychaeton citri CBS 116435 TaxID=1314669 RepID=A0A9P4UKZ0_9PEZI|nr:glycosyltransferase family 2 protein [Polychaeton citri CBS 116435]